jgi:hypothetical protein
MSRPRNVPYGYKLDSKKRKIKDVKQQRCIDLIVELASTGWSLSMIADELQQREMPAPRGGKWATSTLSKLIKQNEDRIPDATSKGETAAALNSQKFQEEADAAWEDAKVNGLVFEEEVWDSDQGLWKTKTRYVAAEEIRNVDELLAMKELEKKEGTSVFRFHRFFSPDYAWLNDPGQRDLKHTDEIVRKIAGQTGDDINRLIDQITDQSSLKRAIRVAMKVLIREVTVQRQENLHLRQELVDLKEKK